MNGQFSRRQVLWGAAALGAGAAFLSGCSAGSPASSASGGSGSAKTELQIWDMWSQELEGEPLAADNARKRYTALHPNTTFNRRSLPQASYKQSIVQAAQAKQLPDFLYSDNPDTTMFAELGILSDLTDRINQWGQWDSFLPGAAESCSYDNKLWGLPDSVQPLALIVNDDLLSAAGVEPPTTFDELRSVAKALTKNKVQGFAIAGQQSESAAFQFEPFLWSQGGDLNDLAGQASRDALQLWADLLADGSINAGCANYDQGDTLSQFVAGQLAMMYNGPWFYQNLKSQDSVKWSVHPLPAGSNGVVTVAGGGNWVVVDGPNADACWDFLTFKSSAEQMVITCKEGGVLPARSDAIDTTEEVPWVTDPALKAWAEMAKVAKARNYGPKYPEMSEVVQVMTQGVLTGARSVDQATGEAAKAMEPLLK